MRILSSIHTKSNVFMRRHLIRLYCNNQVFLWVICHIPLLHCSVLGIHILHRSSVLYFPVSYFRWGVAILCRNTMIGKIWVAMNLRVQISSPIRKPVLQEINSITIGAVCWQTAPIMALFSLFSCFWTLGNRSLWAIFFVHENLNNNSGLSYLQCYRI